MKGRALADWQLYLPASWTDDRDRCRVAGILDGVLFATKVRMAREVLARALDVGVSVGRVTVDEAYGQSKVVAGVVGAAGCGLVVAMRRNDDMITPRMGASRADRLVAVLPARAWGRLSAGAGVHRPGVYWWARVPVRVCWQPGRGHWLLARGAV
ncbi:transposase [Micromonospora sp. NBC_00362]|uniref:transposase n=1 Tax=Micromonospora sp. NBC_00362 TaxID=2975975 RepID=UPI002257D488|nr:transposase [Micromonospora sp. NBC_00362]MCX5121790.1 transposase [Micromonospora sp. NBC_00362]